ncbi:hypothetical protein GQ53DRAFT_843985 [Thozetella sp. PMI_491]|nr:hypothetical protein GQ53DRAFT_843985 [Thozetella sp. PMI_491]
METVQLPPKYTSPKGMWVSKLILRIFQCVIALAVVGLAANLATGDVYTVYAIIIIGPVAGFAFCWAFAEGICILARGGHRGIHPGANVGLDLIIWLALTATLSLLGIIGIAQSTYDLFDYIYSSSRYSYLYSDLLSSAAGKGQAILGLGSLLTLLHFTTFVIACYETNIRNSMGPQTQIIYVNAPPGHFNPSMVPGQMPMAMQPVYLQQAPPPGFQAMPVHQMPFQQQHQFQPPPQNYQYQNRDSTHHEMESNSPLSQPTPVYTPPPQEKHADLHSQHDVLR